MIISYIARVSTYHWSHGEYKAVIFKNTTIDVCEYSGGQFSKLFISIFLPEMITKSNLNTPCPFSGALYMRNFQFSQSLKLPRIVPGKWLLEFQFYVEEYEELTFTVKIHLEVKPIGWHLFEFDLN
ncbi:uncharacterized protein LOC129575016 isoform X2 [Sitodiplosis mosellana]|uniref:uncharacterized protein LOC129575016 isoform X2 n=1 Tax=Sitodiplosis mosellana TaxID=263140 RepID=UPI00244528ED|nr:uncharacterized protein LOC129575016 isoform X2 [Sitodiplosis mosellana]